MMSNLEESRNNVNSLSFLEGYLSWCRFVKCFIVKKKTIGGGGVASVYRTLIATDCGYSGITMCNL